MICIHNKSLFLKVVGASPTMKVLDFLLQNKIFDYSKTDIAKNVNISRTTLDGIIEKFEKFEIIIQTRTVGKAQMYSLNERSPIVQYFEELGLAIARTYAESLSKKKIPIKTK